MSLLRPRPARLGLPDLGCGVGLRPVHYPHLFGPKTSEPHTLETSQRGPAVDFFEIISENFMVAGGKPLGHLDRALASYPVVQHGVSLGIGSSEPLDFDYLRRLKELTRRTATPWWTDHLCWTRAGGHDLHELLPLPYDEGTLRHVVERVRIVQDFLELRLGLENPSSYMQIRGSTMSEADFLSVLAEEADCGLLLDVNNVYVSAFNHGFDASDYIDRLPHHRVLQIHLAGHTHKGSHILDTHDDHVTGEVWELYRQALRLTGPVSTLVEWDAHIPAFEVLQAEADKARSIRREVEREAA